MKSKIKKLLENATVITVLTVVAIFVGVYGISWILTCGVIKLITLCFGLEFSWAWATGIWLILCILESTFKSRSK